MKPLIDERIDILLQDFIIQYNKIYKIDSEKALRIIKSNIKYYKGDKEKRKELSYLQEPEKLWYQALNEGSIDYSVYNDDYYFTDLWACWAIYSRKYLQGIVKGVSLTHTANIRNLIADTKSIIDLGCGIGYTTATLKQLYPNAKVYGTNIEDTKQYLFCKYMSQKFNFKVIPEIAYAEGDIDLIFASEYFEHIENVLEHLEDILELNPKYFVIANAFNTRSVGHFIKYKNKGEIIDQSEISMRFNDILYKNNFIKIKTNLWNNRPSIYIKK